MTRIISLVAIVLMSACTGGEQSSTLRDPNDVTATNGDPSSSTTGGQTTTSQDADSSFSMVFTSDPQFFRRMDFVKKNGTVDDTEDCAPLTNSISAPVGKVGRTVRIGPAKERLSWAKIPQANVFNVYAGSWGLFWYCWRSPCSQAVGRRSRWS